MHLTPGIRHLASSFVFVAVIILACGCDSGLKTYPTSGHVRFEDGTPVAAGTIIFQSVEIEVQARANIQNDGTFHLGTETPDDGAVEGKHRVIVRAQWEGPDTPPKHPVHPKYRSPHTSNLEYEVTPQGPNEFDITVQRPEQR